MDIRIKKAEISDIPDIIRLNAEFNGRGATRASMEEALKNNAREIVLIAVRNDTAAGFICGQIWQSVCYAELQGIIMELFVSEKYRGNGIATKLIQAMEAEFSSFGVNVITLATAINNTIARKFYESRGYRNEEEIIYGKNYHSRAAAR